MSILLEPIAEKHLSRLAELERQCFSTPWSEDTLRGELTNEFTHWIVAVQDGEPVGYAGLQAVADEGSVMNVAVSPDMRCRGIGGVLMSWLCEEAARLGLAFLTLEVRASNESAKTLYARYGFKPVGLRKRYYERPTEDAILMTRRFDAKGESDDEHTGD